MVANNLRGDPTRTKTLRRKFETDLRRRYKKLNAAIYDLVVVKDVFGLVNTRFTFNRNPQPVLYRLLLNVERKEWSFLSDDRKVEEFQQWLSNETGLTIVAEQDRFWEGYVEEGYRKGAGRAYVDSNRRQLATVSGREAQAFSAGRQTEFIRGLLGAPETVEKTKLLAARTFTDLKGVGEVLATQIRKELVDGLVQGENPRTIARRMSTRLDMGRKRAETIARTEIIRAHSEGQLDALERMGITEVGVAVEWETAGDTRVCPLCSDLDGVVLKVADSHNLIPRHPNCRCSFIPANVGESKQGQIRTKEGIQDAFDQSIQSEGGKKRSLAQAKARSRWAGKSKKPAASPKSILDGPDKLPKGNITERAVKPKPLGTTGIKRESIPKKNIVNEPGQPLTYHGTSVQFLEQIKTGGLVPDVGAAGKAVYTTETFGEALEYGVFSAGKKSAIQAGDKLAIVVSRGVGREVAGPHGKWRLFDTGLPTKQIERIEIYDAKGVQKLLRSSEDFPSIEALKPFKIGEDIVVNIRSEGLRYVPVIITSKEEPS